MSNAIPFLRGPATLDLRTRYGTTIRVANDLTRITSFVLLEQEAWFEDEVDFLIAAIRPGARFADVGANAGLYATALARAAGPDGGGVAFEPNPEARARLTRSADLSPGARIVVEPRAAAAATGVVSFNAHEQSELSAFAPDGALEVETVPLDRVVAQLGWSSLDILKIDAEGAEADVLRGARDCLARFAPMVMLELESGQSEVSEAVALFPELGLRSYRLYPGVGALVPFDPSRKRGVMNGFAAAPATAQAWEARGFLVEALAAAPGPGLDAAAYAARLAPAQALPELVASWSRCDRAYLDALGDLLGARARARPPSVRVALLERAVDRLAEAVQARPTPARCLSYLAALADSGEWLVARNVSQSLLDVVTQGGDLHPDEPLVPPIPRYERAWRGGKAADWLKALICAYCMERHVGSTFWMPQAAIAIGEILAGTGYLDGPTARRRYLCARLTGAAPVPPPNGIDDGPLNAELWRTAIEAG